MGERLTISAEVVRWAGGRQARTGRGFVEEAPAGFVLVTASGRVLAVGDAFTKADGGFVAIPDAAWMPLVTPAFRTVLAFVLSVLLPIASALFGWLP